MDSELDVARVHDIVLIQDNVFKGHIAYMIALGHHWDAFTQSILIWFKTSIS